MMIEHRNNTVLEHEAAYAAAGATQNHALVQELWAIDSQSDQFHVQRTAERSGLPAKWLSSLPKINGKRGIDKLMEERDVLLFPDCVKNLLEIEHGGQAIVSFSVNTDAVCAIGQTDETGNRKTKSYRRSSVARA